jgi:two-component system NtrC family sensor kinase
MYLHFMTIRPKVIALVASMLVVLGVVQILVEQRILMPSFAELEHEDARTAMRRINYALDLTLERLALSASDWGNWIDTYRFVSDHDPDYVRANVTAVGLKQLQVNAMLVVDADGNIVMSNTLDLNSERPLDLDFAARKALPADFPWRANLRDGHQVEGFLQTNRGIMMIAAAPVLDGNGGGPQRGMVMLGRLLSSVEIQRIGAQAQAQLSMAPASDARVADQMTESADLTQVFRSLNDIYGRPLMALRVDVPRRITQRGESAIAYASASLVAAALVVLILLVLVLNRVVLRPLAQVTRHAVSLGESEDLGARLDFKGSDEIGQLAREFDRMLERVAESRRQVVDQSFHAGFAELAKGVLHNLGNAMTPIGVRLSGLGQRLGQAPTAEVEQATEELQHAIPDAARRADLEQFLRLAGSELARTLRGAQEDVAVLTRQTSIVQSALSEQMRATRNEHVIESVRLPELIAQTLEVVPDACRQRLRIDADESLRKVGVVHVARTVLRLVLQNLIINASDAVRDAGRERGTLRVTAAVVHEPATAAAAPATGAAATDTEYLHLQCQDDGVGIPQDHLDRVFEKGFSTKSRGTNYGIGLHWCSNAISALGGRMWAASAGPGRGASLHLVLPLTSRRREPCVEAA